MSRLIIDTTIKGEPFPAMRPRADFDRRRMYTPAKYRDELERLAWLFAAARELGPVDETVHVRARFYVATRKAGYDLDNLLKTVLDAGNGVLWADDKLVHVADVSKAIGVGEANAMTRLVARTIEP